MPVSSCSVPPARTVTVIELVDRFLSAYSLYDLHGCTVIVEPDRIRIRRPE
jgi:hypothetical protein